MPDKLVGWSEGVSRACEGGGGGHDSKSKFADVGVMID